MEFSTKTDIEAPIAHVFAQLTDFPVFERQAMRRGADVRRRDTLARPGVGSAWDVTFKFRGKDRHVVATVTAFEMLNGYSVTATSGGLDSVMVIDLVVLSRTRTRLSVTLTLVPKTLTARIMVQSMKLGRGNLNRKFAARVEEYALDVQGRYKRPG